MIIITIMIMIMIIINNNNNIIIWLHMVERHYKPNNFLLVGSFPGFRSPLGTHGAGEKRAA